MIFKSPNDEQYDWTYIDSNVKKLNNPLDIYVKVDFSIPKLYIDPKDLMEMDPIIITTSG